MYHSLDDPDCPLLLESEVMQDTNYLLMQSTNAMDAMADALAAKYAPKQKKTTKSGKVKK